MLIRLMPHLRGGGQFPLKTVKYEDTHRNLNTYGPYYVYADDLIAAGIEFPQYSGTSPYTTSTRIFVSQIFKKGNVIVATFVLPLLCSYITNEGYNVDTLGTGIKEITASSDESDSSRSYKSRDTDASKAYYSYGFISSNIPDYDTIEFYATYYLIGE